MKYSKKLTSESQTGTIFPDPRCLDCLVKLVEDVTRIIAKKVVGLEEHIRSESKRILAHGVANHWTSPECANEILRVIRSVSGVADPYEAAKLTEMAQAKSVFEQVKDRVGNDFRSAVDLAVLGNSFDFFRSTDDALADVTGQIGNDLVYFHDDLDRLQESLMKNPGLVLYFTDNSGEIFFDLPLFKYIQKRAERTVLVVKGGPSLNDLTRSELGSSAIRGMFGDVMDTGTDGAGIDWRHVSSAFKEIVDRADLIVSKGMANLETVYFRRLKTPVFFLFRAKCPVVADYFKAPVESQMALWKA